MFGEMIDAAIYLRPGFTDFRKSVNGLSVMAQEAMGKEPMSGDMFVFCNRGRNRLKVLYWERNGFCLWYKRLEEEKFVWPKTEEEALEITRDEFVWLLRGLDFFRAHKKLSYCRV